MLSSPAMPGTNGNPPPSRSSDGGAPSGRASEVTALLAAWSRGDASAYDRLVPLVYSELREMAGRYLRRERPDHTLQPTALVHEAYLRLVDQTSARWSNREQFFAIAAQAMRRILVDHARGRDARKRGGDVVRVPLDDAGETPGGPDAAATAAGPREADLVDLDDALRELAGLDPELVKVVELRYFAGLTIEETAAARGVSPATVKREWAAARAWLFRRLRGTAT